MLPFARGLPLLPRKYNILINTTCIPRTFFFYFAAEKETTSECEFRSFPDILDRILHAFHAWDFAPPRLFFVIAPSLWLPLPYLTEPAAYLPVTSSRNRGKVPTHISSPIRSRIPFNACYANRERGRACGRGWREKKAKKRDREREKKSGGTVAARAMPSLIREG